MSTPDEVHARLVRVEEAQGFTERAIEQLSEEIALLGRRVAEMKADVTRLEAKLSQAQESQEDAADEGG